MWKQCSEIFLFDPAEKIGGKPEKIELQRRIAEQRFLNQSRLDQKKETNSFSIEV
jgi:hypothetical protein